MSKIKNTFLISPDDIKGSTYVNYNVDDSLLGPAIKEAQEVGLQSIIGTALLRKLQELVLLDIEGKEGGIESAENAGYKELLDDYVTDYLEARSEAVLAAMVSFKMRNAGVVKNSDTNLQAPTIKEVMFTQRRFTQLSDRYATALSKYLCANKEAFPELEYSNCGCSGDVQPQIGKRFVDVGLWLGGSVNDCCCK